jgi:hypothetical protein
MELGKVVELVDTTWPREAELADMQETIAALNASFRTRKISNDRYFEQISFFEAQEKELLAEQRKHLAAVTAARARPANIRREWKDYPLSQRKAIVEDYIHAVIINKARHKGSRFDPELIDIRWKGDDANAEPDIAPDVEADAEPAPMAEAA